MKKVLIILFFLHFNLIGANSALSATVELTGKINFLRMLDRVKRPLWTDAAWFTLDGGTAAGSCAKSNGFVIIEIQSNEEYMFSSVLAAYMADKTITAAVDTALVSVNGNCFAEYLDLK